MLGVFIVVSKLYSNELQGPRTLWCNVDNMSVKHLVCKESLLIVSILDLGAFDRLLDIVIW